MRAIAFLYLDVQLAGAPLKRQNNEEPAQGKGNLSSRNLRPVMKAWELNRSS